MSEVTPHSVAIEVAAEVRAELGRQRLPQRLVAEAIGLSQQAASRRLNGDVPFDVVELTKVAELLGVPVSRLLNGERAA